MQKIIVIVGPTASGKSAFAVALARKIGGEIISADSRQVYTGLDIGTGKITKREMRGIPHHLLDIASPRRIITAHDFAMRGHAAIAAIAARDKIPIIAGGTGFYIDALVGRIALAPVPIDTKLRAHLDTKSAPQLFALLKRRDPKRAHAIIERNEMNNKHRLIRALEITYSRVASPTEPPAYDVRWFGIRPDMQELKKKIRVRLLARLRQGMIREAERLHENGLAYTRMHALGLEYRYMALYLQKKITKDALVEQLPAKIWQYARRQVIYWKRNKDIQWNTLAAWEKDLGDIARQLS
ncbi:MAG: tRNA (adenosine(37)-N6)-dimethylallyltransferase MiaA [Parcubacteria group bacterium]|nr:tRNA (adenosine(37)-N6)-dimethylallyltransferase MiaA [Parcubacteria group bacterium]